MEDNPFDTDSFDRQPEILDSDLARSPKKKDPLVFAIFAAIFGMVVLILFSFGYWLQTAAPSLVSSSSFYQVTNRQISAFLWQFPHLMRQQKSSKSGYLPGFDYITRIGIKEGKGDEKVQAPQELLYLYHTWNRLVRGELPKRAIPMLQFYEFIELNPEWDPSQWKEAPNSYRQLVRRLQFRKINETQWIHEEKNIPEEVRAAFMGWKNFSLESAMINEQIITVGKMESFLQKYPHYARNYWKNLVQRDFPNYLLSVWEKKEKSEIVPSEETPAFLKQAFWNEEQASKGM